MFSGPMFRWERQTSSRRRRPFIFRTVFTIVLSLVAAFLGYVCYSTRASDNGQLRLLYFGRALLIATMVVELLFLLFFVPSQVGGAIAEEREKDTLPLLLLTRLTPIEIVLTKALARWLPAASLVVTGVPFLVAAAWSAGLEFEAALATIVLLGGSAFMASLAIWSSARHEKAAVARGEATGVIFGWLIGPPILTIIPVASGSIWGDLLVEAKLLCSAIAPSSPLSLLTDPGWYYRSNALGLEARVALMIGLQALFGMLAIGEAAGRLRARERHPNSLDPTRGHRPRCGDDPIVWREHELPIRRGAGSLLVIRLRYVWILVRGILASLLALASTLVIVAIPMGLFVATVYYGQAAFREVWESGYAGPSAARGHFTMVVRAATGMLAFFPLMNVAPLIAGRIVAERDRKSWDAFLTTPLTGGEILRSKAKAALHGLWHSARPVPIVWALGLACGAVTPLGVLLATADLAVSTWACVALGLYLGARPLSTASISNRSSLAMLAYFVTYGPLLAVALGSPTEWAEIATWDPRLRGSLIGASLALPIITGVIAWRLTRVTRGRFDEWAGRPIRGQPPPA